ncbi:uncharacterized protein B0H18DRAFT_1218207 [Fomitopsis serialis]|uniref:uncharacterized protein n=1 Tax=Fomitopsis serialis TaxID=139415 RepID=UPI002007E0BE|nr:uncharacterized protein B0H18DRAFT_1218207 [Neoantrodia serialis]KAH9911455.1 hypothetical protein B0H18DRAFT_1218207 [Neoantrodia serialis]
MLFWNTLVDLAISQEYGRVTTNTSEPTRSSRGSRSGTRSRLKALRAEIRAKLAASQERLNEVLAESIASQQRMEAALVEAAASQQRINSALEESQQLQTDLLESVDNALTEASSQNSAGALTELVASDRKVECAPRSEQLKPEVELAQSRPEIPSPPAPAQPTKLGTTVKSGARARLDGATVAEPEPEFNEREVEPTRIRAREGIGTQLNGVPSENGTELASSRVARSEMSRDIKHIIFESSNALDVSNDALDTAGDALDTRTPNALPALDRHHLADDLPPGTCLDRQNAHRDECSVPTGRNTRIRDWLAELPSVQLAAREDPAGNARPPSPSSPRPPTSSARPLFDPLSSPLYPGDFYPDLCDPGDTQQSRAAQDSHNARASPAPSHKVAQATENAAKGTQKEEGEKGRKREEGKGTGRAWKTSMTAQKPQLVVHPAGHQDSTSAFWDDSYVVPTALDGTTADAQSCASDVPVPSLLPAPAGVSTHEKSVVHSAGHEDGSSVFRDNLMVVPDVLQGNTSDAHRCTSDVPRFSTNRRTVGTSSILLDVQAVDEDDAALGVLASVPGVLVELSGASDGPEVHPAKVHPVRTSPVPVPKSRSSTMDNKTVAHFSDVQVGALDLSRSTTTVSAAPTSQDDASGESPSSTRPSLPILLPQHAADTSSLLLDVSAAAPSLNARDVRPSVLAANHHAPTWRNGAPGERSSSTGSSLSLSTPPRARCTSSPSPDVHTADLQDACDAPSSVLAATPQASTLRATSTSGSRLDVLLAVETGNACNALANEPSGVMTHDVFDVPTGTIDMSSYFTTRPAHRTMSTPGSRLDVLTVDEPSNTRETRPNVLAADLKPHVLGTSSNSSLDVHCIIPIPSAISEEGEGTVHGFESEHQDTRHAGHMRRILTDVQRSMSVSLSTPSVPVVLAASNDATSVRSSTLGVSTSIVKTGLSSTQSSSANVLDETDLDKCSTKDSTSNLKDVLSSSAASLLHVHDKAEPCDQAVANVPRSTSATPSSSRHKASLVNTPSNNADSVRSSMAVASSYIKMPSSSTTSLALTVHGEAYTHEDDAIDALRSTSTSSSTSLPALVSATREAHDGSDKIDQREPEGVKTRPLGLSSGTRTRKDSTSLAGCVDDEDVREHEAPSMVLQPDLSSGTRTRKDLVSTAGRVDGKDTRPCRSDLNVSASSRYVSGTRRTYEDPTLCVRGTLTSISETRPCDATGVQSSTTSALWGRPTCQEPWREPQYNAHTVKARKRGAQ